MHRTLYLLGAMALAAAGCTRLRFVVDLVPADEGLGESVVLRDAGASADKVALIEVSGPIADAAAPRLLGGGDNPVGRFAESLHRAEQDQRVKAVVIRINSPGGTVGATEEMHRELLRFKERSGRPVVVCMGEVAASGGYYLACGADRILALPSTITGSIGVIMQTVNVSEGLQRIGIRADAITSGPNKAVGSPLQPMSAEHRSLLQGIVDEMYASFRAVVVTGRPGVAPADLEAATDGRVVTGRRAAELGLVDAIGDVRDAFAAAKELAGLDRARLVKYHGAGEHAGSAWSHAGAPTATPQVNLVQLNLGLPAGLDQPAFWYLWDPAAW
jgi:protease-4